MPPTYVRSLLTSFLFFDHCYDLFVRETCLHLSVLLVGRLYTNLEEFKGRRSVWMHDGDAYQLRYSFMKSL
nr:hypothetical protein [Roseobacter litoralis]